LLLLLAARVWAIPSASHLRMFPSASLLSAHFFLLLMLSSHLGMTRFHLGIASTHLSVPRHLLTHGRLAVARASLLAAFAGTHFSLVALKVLVVAGVFVPVFFAIHSFSLPAMFSHLPGLVLTLSCSSFASSANALSGLTLPRAFALAILFSHFAGLVLTLSCSSFAASANTLSALTLPRAFALAILFSHFAGLVFTLSCSGSPCGPESLRAFALAGTFALVE